MLKECIADMITDKYSDDDDGKSSKEKLDPYAGSLRLKEGGNIQNNLYYDDHNKLSNEGSGLIPDELLCIQRSKAECDQLNQQLKSITVEANQLESEPRSEDLILEVVDLESNKYMDDALEDDLGQVWLRAPHNQWESTRALIVSIVLVDGASLGQSCCVCRQTCFDQPCHRLRLECTAFVGTAVLVAPS